MAKLNEHPDQKRNLLKRRLEELTTNEAKDREALKVRRQKLDEMLAKVDQEYAEISYLQLYCDDIAMIIEARKKELAKLDSDRLFNDIDQAKPVAPKSSGKKAEKAADK